LLAHAGEETVCGFACQISQLSFDSSSNHWPWRPCKCVWRGWLKPEGQLELRRSKVLQMPKRALQVDSACKITWGGHHTTVLTKFGQPSHWHAAKRAQRQASIAKPRGLPTSCNQPQGSICNENPAPETSPNTSTPH
jgi:hypothetical protein